MRLRTGIIVVCLLIHLLLAVSICSCSLHKLSVDTSSEKSKEFSGELSETTSVSDDGHNSKDNVPKILKFVDVFGKEYQTFINPNVPQNIYNPACYEQKEFVTYEDDRFYSRLGIDVSHHQKDIDWDEVKRAGYEFAFIRIGYRGYGKAGLVSIDRWFEKNIVNAKNAGIDVGIYFFSQAINEEEAREEAEFVIEHLKGHKIDLPVAYDAESILDDVARTDDITGEQFTKNAVVFCEAIKAAGYQPMIYCNMLWEAFEYDMTKLTEYPFWYADYEPRPQTPYAFRFWQYTNEAKVPGISGDMDINIEIIPK